MGHDPLFIAVAVMGIGGLSRGEKRIHVGRSIAFPGTGEIVVSISRVSRFSKGLDKLNPAGHGHAPSVLNFARSAKRRVGHAPGGPTSLSVPNLFLPIDS